MLQGASRGRMKHMRLAIPLSLVWCLCSCGAAATTDMERKATSRAVIELWASQPPVPAEELLAPDYMNHQAPSAQGGVATLDLESYLMLLEGYHSSFSDSVVEILMQIAESDRVATLWRFTATQSGEYEGEPPTNRRATWTGIQIDRYEGDTVVESWVNWDKFYLFEQLGFIE